MMKEMKRVLSMVLCLVMILGMMPMVALNASAAEGTDSVSDTAEGEYTIPGESKTAYVRASSLVSGQQYLLVSDDGQALTISSGTIGYEEVAIKTEESNTYIEEDQVTDAMLLTVVRSDEYYKIHRDGSYLRYSKNGNSLSTGSSTKDRT